MEEETDGALLRSVLSLPETNSCRINHQGSPERRISSTEGSGGKNSVCKALRNENT